MVDRNQRLTEIITTQLVIIISLVFLILGAILLYFNYGIDTAINTTLSQIGGSLIAIGLVSFVWQLTITRRVTDEVIEKTNLSHNLVTSGLVEVIDDFSQIDWKPLFESVNKRLDLFFMMALRWTNNNETLFNKIADKDVEVNLILPDVDDPETKESLKNRLKPDYKIEEIETTINNIRGKYEKIFSGKKAHLRIWYYQKPLVFSIYRFDDEVIFALNSHSGSPPVPAFKFKKGKIYEFLDNEIDFLTPEPNKDFSRKVYDNKDENNF